MTATASVDSPVFISASLAARMKKAGFFISYGSGKWCLPAWWFDGVPTGEEPFVRQFPDRKIVEMFFAAFDDTACPLCEGPTSESAVCGECASHLRHAAYTVGRTESGPRSSQLRHYAIVNGSGYAWSPVIRTENLRWGQGSHLGHAGRRFDFVNSVTGQTSSSNDVWCWTSNISPALAAEINRLHPTISIDWSLAK
jgi:hypothetical protein